MYASKQSTLLFGLLSLSLVSFSKHSTCKGNGKTIKLSNEKVTWKQAYEKCLSGRGYLGSPDDLPCTPSSSTYDFWMPGVFVETPAIYIKGCYAISTENVSSFTLTNNDIATCYERCYQIALMIKFFALQGDTCVCLNDSLDTNILRTGICTKLCQGNNEQLCGGTSIYSVFEIAPENFITKDEQLCAYFIVGIQEIKFEFCDNKDIEKKSYCKRWVKDTKSDNVYKEELAFYTWDHASYNCQSHDSSLADLNIDTIDTLSSANRIDVSHYWIGLRKWIYSVRRPDERKLLSCSISRYDVGEKNVSCDDMYQYICITDTVSDGSNTGGNIQTTVTSPGDQSDNESSDMTSPPLDDDVIRATSGSYTKGAYEIILGIIGACAILLCILLMLVVYKKRRNRMQSGESRDIDQQIPLPRQNIAYNIGQPEMIQSLGDEYNHLHLQNKREARNNGDSTYDVMKPLGDDLYDHTCRTRGPGEPYTDNEYSHMMKPADAT